MSTASEGDGGFLAFYREYAHTGIHTITATALTAFGLLTFVHRGFVVLAIAVYVLPPIYLYLTRGGDPPEPIDRAGGEDIEDGEDGESRVDDRERPVEGTEAEPEIRSEPDDAEAERPEGRPEPAESPSDEPDPGPAADSVSRGSGAIGNDTGDTDDTDDASGQPVDLLEHRAEEVESAEWAVVEAPTDATLFDAVSTPEIACAVGAGGVLLARGPEGEWEVAIEGGPAAESATLRGVDSTDDGEAVWITGDGGALGRYDPDAGRHTDHSAPEGITDNWSDLAVAGSAGTERIALVNGSGQVLLGEYDGATVEWTEPTKPGSGSSMSAVVFVDDSLGYCCDTNAGVYRIDGEFERIGIEDASGFDALAATGDTVAVASDDGTVQRFDGSVWTPVQVSDGALSGLATDGEEWLAVGAGGAIHESRDGDWEPADSPADEDLFGVAVGAVAIAVGADGTVLERSP